MDVISPILKISFIGVVLLTLWLFYKASNNKKTISLIFIWMGIVGVMGYVGFYQKVGAIPPRFFFLLGPAVFFVLIFTASKWGKSFIYKLDLKWLTLLHVVRIPVEIVLYYVSFSGLIPDLMTFEGYNFDILSGITAPIIYYLVFVKQKISYKGLLIWNFICLALLINILTIAILSAQTPIQMLAFEQPNIGVTFFPFVWLPAVIVPIVLFSHLASIKLLLSKCSI